MDLKETIILYAEVLKNFTMLENSDLVMTVSGVTLEQPVFTCSCKVISVSEL